MEIKDEDQSVRPMEAQRAVPVEVIDDYKVEVEGKLCLNIQGPEKQTRN